MDSDTLKMEKQFIYLLLHHKQLVEDWISSNLKIEHFSEDHQPILHAIIESYDNGFLLTRKTFMKMRERLSSPKDRVEQETNFNLCLITRADENDFNTLLNQLLDIFVFRATTENIKKFSSLKEKHGSTYALKHLVSGLQELETESFSKENVLYEDMSEVSKVLLQVVKDGKAGLLPKIPKVFTGISEIDQTMLTGLAPGTFTLICADVGGYKSSMMLNIGLNVWKLGHDVLFVPIEMPKEQMWDRAMARESKVPMERILNPETLTDSDIKKLEAADKAWSSSKSKFFMFRMPESTTVSSLKRNVDKHIDIFKPKVVIIDYMDNLDPDRTHKDRHDLEVHDMILSLRKIGENRGFAVISGAQLGRDALKRIRKSGSSKEKTSVNSEDIRGAHAFAMAADYILAQVPNPQQPTTLLDIFVVKARNGKKTFSNNSLKGTLEIVPDIGLIRSQQEFDVGNDSQIDKMFESNQDDDVIVNKEDLINDPKEESSDW